MAPPDAEQAIPLEALQGEWVASRGEVIRVVGADLEINGKAMPGGLRVSPDGRLVVGFGIYKAAATVEEAGQVVWQAGYQEIIWRRPAEGEVRARAAHMDAAMRQTASTCGGQTFEALTEQEAVRRLNELIERWREGPAVCVRSCDVCPDWTNRAETGLSVEHVHYIAALMSSQGFKSRRRGLGTQEGAHDVPVLVRETAGSELGSGALAKWREATRATPGFPPYLLDGKEEFFCSLGNGHFSQALNLFRTASQNLWTERPYTVGDDGRVRLEEEGPAALASQFVALSKVLDAEELSCLVRQKLGVDVDGNPVDRAEDFEDSRPSESAVAAAGAGAEEEEEQEEAGKQRKGIVGAPRRSRL